VLNTAIATHKAELDALRAVKPDPLADTLADMMRGIAKFEIASAAIDTLGLINDNINDRIEEWVDDNLADKLNDWHSENIDMDSEIEKYLRNNDLDFVAEQVTRYFGNNTFSLEPR